MAEFLGMGIVAGIWILLQVVILPRMGVST